MTAIKKQFYLSVGETYYGRFLDGIENRAGDCSRKQDENHNSAMSLESATDSLEEPLLSHEEECSSDCSENNANCAADESADSESSAVVIETPSAQSVSFFAQLRALTPEFLDSSENQFIDDEIEEDEEVDDSPTIVSGWNQFIRRHSSKLLFGLCLLWPLGAYSFHLLEQRTDSTFHPVPNSPSQLAIDAFKSSYPHDWSTNPALYVVLTTTSNKSLTYRYSDAFVAASKWTKGLNLSLESLNDGLTTTASVVGEEDGNRTQSVAPWIKMVSFYDFVERDLSSLANAMATPYGRSVICQVQYLTNNATDYHAEHELIDTLVEKMQTYAETHPSELFDVGFTGLKFFSNDLRVTTHQDLRRMDMLVLPIALLLIGYVLPRAKTSYVWIIPLITMLSTVACWSLVLNQVAHYMQITQFTPSIMMSLTLGMGIDYTLFLLARYLEVAANVSRSRAIMHMIRTGGHVLVLSGLTLLCVFLGLCCLPLSMLQSIGVGCAVAIACALVVNLTLVPALLYTRVGDWIINREMTNDVSLQSVPSLDESERFGDREFSEQVIPALPSIWFRMSKQLLHKYRGMIILLVTCQLIIPVAMFSGDVKSSLSFDLLLPRDSPSMEVFENLGDQVGEGKLNPYRILFDGHEANITMSSSRGFKVMHDVLKRLHSMDNPGGEWMLDADQNGLQYDEGAPSDFSVIENRLDTVTSLNFTGRPVVYNGIAMVSNLPLAHWIYDSAKACVESFDPCPVQHLRVIEELDELCTSNDEYATFVSATLADNPFNDEGIIWLQNARQTITDMENELQGVKVHIDGPASVAHDAVHAVHNSFLTMIVVTTIIVFVLMGIFFKSVFTPLRSVISIGLTLGFSFGWTVLVFQKGILSWTQVRAWTASDHELCWLVPVMSFSMVVGLALDYDVFLMSRILEYRRDEEYEHRSSIAAGLHSTGSIITAAGCIMALAFGSLSLSASPVLVQWSCVITTAVLLDTYVIRTIVVPILTGLAGDSWCWWPHRNLPSGRLVFEVFRDDADITDFVRALEASSEYEALPIPQRESAQVTSP